MFNFKKGDKMGVFGTWGSSKIYQSNRKKRAITPNEKEILFLEVLSDFLEKEYKIDRTEALAQSCIIMDKLKEKGLEIK